MEERKEWVNLLKTPEERPAKPRLTNGGGSVQAARAIKISENTPKGKVGVKKNKSSEADVLRSQVASLVKEKKELSRKGVEREKLLEEAREELKTNTSQNQTEMEDQRRVIHKLSSDNARLIRQMELLWQQSPELKTPPNHTHPNGILIKDLERLSQRATELSQALSSTQQARTALEREVLSLKRSQLELQTSRSELEESLAKSEEERAELYHRLQETEEGGRRNSEQLQLQMEVAMSDKNTKMEELLSLSERLQTALTSLSQDKTTLETRLRDETNNSQLLSSQNNSLRSKVDELETNLDQANEELGRLQDHQLQEVSEMRTLLETEMMTLQQERDSLTEQVEEEREERELVRKEVEATRAEMIRAESEVERLTEEVDRLQLTLREAEKRRASEVSKLTARVAELSAQVHEMERENNDRDNITRQQKEELTNQFAESRIHANQLEAEAQQLRQLLDTRSHDLQSKSHDLDSALSELHSTKMANASLEQKVTDLEGKVVALHEQIDARTELTNEMRDLLEQRANQIQELEDIVAQQRDELMSVSSHTHLSASHTHQMSGDSAHISQATPIQSPYSSRQVSPEPRPLTTPTTDVLRVKKQLTESRSRVLELESNYEELRTESAKYQGSVQALTIIRDKLIEENKSLDNAKRRAEEGQRSAEEGRRRSEERRKALSRQLSSLQSVVSGLRSQVNELRGEKEEAMSQMSELQEAFAEREAELTEELAVMEEQSIAAASESGEMERDYLQLELAKSRSKCSELEQQLLQSQRVMERERDELQGEADKCSSDLCTLRRDDAGVQEECRLAAAVNAKQTNQITEKEGCVSELLGEVEVLRARKAVMMKWLCDSDSGRKRESGVELEMVKEELRQCKERHEAQVLSLTQQLEMERERGEESGRSLVVEGCGQQQRSYNRKLEKLRSRLRGQVEQSNYLRVKLGYTLKELQLYKDLKSQLDSQLSQQATEITCLQDHYGNCLQQLQQAESLGFQATVS